MELQSFCRSFEPAEEGRPTTMQSSGTWEVLCAEEHPAGVIQEPLPDLFQDQGRP